MAQGHRIVVRVLPSGAIEVAVDGVKGASCKDVTRAVERALGTVTDDRKTPEFYGQVTRAAEVRQEGGAK